METKKDIRARILKLRDRQEPFTWKRGTEFIEEQIIRHEWFLESPAVYCYVSCRGEAGTEGIIREAWRLGKEVYVPRVSEGKMEFFLLDSFDDLKAGIFNIPEPVHRSCEVVGNGRKGELMIVPGVAFDERRNRIGYGGGYYDRYLSAHPGLHTIALAFEFQVEREVPYGPSDIRPEIVVTERRIL